MSHIVAGDAALLVDPSEADAMRRMFEDPGLAERLCRRSLERARLFSWERPARETLVVYDHGVCWPGMAGWGQADEGCAPQRGRPRAAEPGRLDR